MDQWFAQRGWQVFDFQRDCWQAWLAGDSGLLHSATGSGKTLAAWGGPLLDWMQTPAQGLNVLWITPLRALAADTAGNLARPVAELELPLTVGVRTGDTSSGERARQRRSPPNALVTTPESLSLMLTYADARQRLRRLRGVVVDEWHELLGSKRGVLLELALSRLRSWNPGLRIWGLSATLDNLEQARRTLLGVGGEGHLIRGDTGPRVVVDSVKPAEPGRFPWAGHLGLSLLRPVVEAIRSCRSTLLFTNTRSQAELWYRAITAVAPDWAESTALHHGSIAPRLRRQAEDGLRDGSLRCVVATSSLDLGVDFSPVDQVIQVGSPKGIARLMQRAGRSGHRPGEPSRVLCVPTHGLELLEIAAARRGIETGRLEPRRPLTGCLDVLAQHLVTLALGGGFRPEDTLAEIRTTHAYAGLSDTLWDWLLQFITQGGPVLEHYPQFQRVTVDGQGVYRVRDRRIASLHRLSVGTITSDGHVQVRFRKGASLGQVEEAFIARLRPGDRFLFAGRVLELLSVKDMTAFVRHASGKRDAVPRWMGGRLPLSNRLADQVLALLEAVAAGRDTEPEVASLQPLLDLQMRWSELPARDRLLVEQTRSRDGHHLMLYPFAGRLVHEGLAALLAFRLSRVRPTSFSMAVNDYGLVLNSADPVVPGHDGWPGWDTLLDTRSLAPDILDALNAGEMARRQFREIARVAGLVFQGYPGRGKSVRQIQASSGLIFDVLQRYEASHPLLAQASDEVLEQELEFTRLRDTLERLRDMTISQHETERLTPLAFPLWVERIRGRLSSEDANARIERMVRQLSRAADRSRRAV